MRITGGDHLVEMGSVPVKLVTRGQVRVRVRVRVRFGHQEKHQSDRSGSTSGAPVSGARV